MSSTYNLICLSHDPAIVIDVDWQSGADGRTVAEHQLTHAAESQHEQVRMHAHCDLVIGRYSYPLVEVGYATADRARVLWIDAAWLVPLAWLAVHKPDAAPPLPGGWTMERARRLRYELRVLAWPWERAEERP